MSFVVSLAMEDWFVDIVVDVEVRVVLDAVRVMVGIGVVPRVEGVRVRRVVVAAFM